MQSDILLTVCPPFSPKMPPMCLAYLSSYLKAHDFLVDIYDMNIDVYNEVDAHLKSLWNLEISSTWNQKNILSALYKEDENKEIDKLATKLLSFNAKMIGFSVNSGNRITSIKVIEALKKKNKDTVVVVGGMGCFHEDERRLFPDELVDAFVVGEGEKTLFEMLKNSRSGKSFDTIAGVVLPGKEKLYQKRKLIDKLDQIPHPDYKEFALDDYETDMIPLLASRGCVNKCSFCSDHYFWQGKYRSRSAEHVFAEIKYNVDVLEKHNFMFYDLLLNGNLKELDQLTELLMNWDQRISWMGDMLASPKLTKNVFLKMREAGCYALCFGIESGANSVLKKMRKNFKIEEARQNLKDANAAGIANYVNIIVGFPGEGEQEFAETMAFLKESAPDIEGINNINSCNLVTHTDLFNNYQKYGITLLEDDKHLDWVCGTDNNESIRQNRVKRLREFVASLEKNIYNDNVADMESDGRYFNNYDPWQEASDVLLIHAPYGDIQTPSFTANAIAECLTKKGSNAALVDLNILLYGELSMQYREYWAQHKCSLWLEEASFVDLLKKLDKKFDKYIERLATNKPKTLLFVVNHFNWQATRYIVSCLEKKGASVRTAFFLEELFATKEAVAFLKKRECLQTYQQLAGYFSFDIDILADVFVTYSKSNLKMYSGKELPVYVTDFFDKPKSKQDLWEEIKYHMDHNCTNKFILQHLEKLSVSDIEKLLEFLSRNLTECKTLNLRIICENPRCFSKTILKKYKKIGMNALTVEMGSASNDILTLMGKNTQSTDYERLLQDCHSLGITIYLSITVGFHGETQSDYEATCIFLKRNASRIYKMSRVNKHVCKSVDCAKNANKKLGVIYPMGQKERLIDWQDANGNSDALRTARLFKLLKLLKDLNIEVLSSNINYTACNKIQASKDALINLTAFNNALFEIVAYKDAEISKLDLQKNKAISDIAKESAAKFKQLEKIMIHDKTKFEKHLKNITTIKDKEIKQLVTSHEKRLQDVVDAKNTEIKKLVKEAAGREKEIIAVKDLEISQLVKKYESYVADVVKEKDSQIIKLANECDSSLKQKDGTIAELRKEIESIYQTKWFKIQSAFSNLLGKGNM